MAIAAILSLLPTRWLVGWTSDVAETVRIPLIVPQHLFSAARHWLRPMPRPGADAPEEIVLLEEQLEQARTRYKRLELEREELLGRIGLLEGAGRAAIARGADERMRRIYGTVVATTPTSARSPGSLSLNVGEAHAVEPGMVAIWEGDILVGRVADQVGRLTTMVIPADGLSGFQVRFFPPDRDLPVAQAPGGVLKAMRDGTWTTDLTQPGDIAEGWIARMADERWPSAARGLRVGVVERAAPRDDAPLVRRLTVRPLVDPFRVPHVLLIDDPALADGRVGSPVERRP